MNRVRIGACILFVLLVYAFFASDGTWRFPTLQWFETHSDSLGADYYARQAEGFRTGHLYIAATADPRLLTLKDPYNPDERGAAGVEGLWDASYFRGHYYLYFTPLPVIFFYLPFRLIFGAYPPDPLAAVFFSGWAFVFALLFLRRAIQRRVWLWTLVAAFSNVVIYVMPDVRIYEVAAMCGMAMSMTWAWALLRFVEQPSPRAAAWMTLWLALSIAARPNLLVLIVPAALAIWPVRNFRIARAALLPLAITMLILLGYNTARFHKPFEFGRTYQLEFTSMVGRRLCGICNGKEALRFVNNTEHYLFWSPSFDRHFPWVGMQIAHLDPEVSAPLDTDTILGVVPLLPLVLAGSLFALVLGLRRDSATTAATHVMFGAWLTLAALSTCWWVVARYSLDFMLLMAVATAVCIERGIVLLEEAGARTFLLRLTTTILATYSILLGILLGFEGLGGSFRRFNPTLYQSIGRMLHVKVR